MSLWFTSCDHTSFDFAIDGDALTLTAGEHGLAYRIAAE